MINYSIIIPHKNIPDLLTRCVNSIPQRGDIQIIVVDDNSDQAYLDIFPSFYRSDLEVIFTKEGRGAGYARNIGLKRAKGKWLLFADADDYYTGGFLDVLDKYKETSNNLINHTPFFIWSSDLGQLTSISKVNMQMDILPTVLNLFGIDYNSNNYIGHDILSNDFKGYAFFSDYSWYDGKVYVENQQITNGKKMSTNKLDSMNNLISDVIKKNDLTLKYDYFKSK